ncbi:MAG TPA: flagellar hook basal-body protein [Syntrophorhabdaceae bacterium]|jgi:flagellar basal-body rod protein FlgG
MSKIASDALTGALKAQMKKMDIVTNNLANMSTPGYKAMRTVFHGFLADQMPHAGGDTDESLSDSAANTFIDFSQAPLLETGGMLNVAIEGPGLFVVSTPGGPMYTRNGQFSLDKEQRLVTGSGHPVMGQDGAIIAKGSTIRIETDGSILADHVPVGRLQVVDFKDRTQLYAVGAGLFSHGTKKIPAESVTKYSVRQGFIEISNVILTQEIIELITCVRTYQAYKKVDKLMDEADDRMFTISTIK